MDETFFSAHQITGKKDKKIQLSSVPRDDGCHDNSRHDDSCHDDGCRGDTYTLVSPIEKANPIPGAC